MKKLISLIFLSIVITSCSSKPEDPMITPPGYKEIPKEEDVKKKKEEQKIKQENNEELESLKKLLLQN